MQSAWPFKGCWYRMLLKVPFPSHCMRSKPLNVQNIKGQTITLNEFLKSLNKILSSHSREWMEHIVISALKKYLQSKLEKHTHAHMHTHTHTHTHVAILTERHIILHPHSPSPSLPPSVPLSTHTHTHTHTHTYFKGSNTVSLSFVLKEWYLFTNYKQYIFIFPL